MGLPAMKLDKLNQVLKQAVKNSAAKNYHGGIENAFPLPDVKDRVLEIIHEEGLFLVQEESKNNEDDAKNKAITRYPIIGMC